MNAGRPTSATPAISAAVADASLAVVGSTDDMATSVLLEPTDGAIGRAEDVLNTQSDAIVS